MTTKQLAQHFGVKVRTIHVLFSYQGHYKGYRPINEGMSNNRQQYIWEKKDV